MSRPVFVVLGGTGLQGGSVIDSLYTWNKSHPNQAFQVRAVTRDVNAEKSKALKQKHSDVELVQANMLKKDELLKAFKGAEYLFVLTQFWDPESMGKEDEIGRTIVDAAIECGVKRYVASVLKDVATISNHKYDVPHFTDKWRIFQYMTSKKLDVIGLGPAFYYQNWIGFFPPSRKADGKLKITIPMTKDGFISSFDVEDTGKGVIACLQHWDEWKGRFIPLCGLHARVQEHIKIMSDALGEPIELESIPREVWNKFPFPHAAEIGDMCGWFEEYQYFGPNEDLDVAKRAGVQFTEFKAWTTKNVAALKSGIKPAQ